MQKEVVDAPDREPAFNTASLGVEVHHGVVKVAGSVPGDSSKETAERAAERAAGRVDGVEVHHGVVKVAGSVPGDSSKETAERAAGRVDGVEGVVMDADVASAEPARPV